VLVVRCVGSGLCDELITRSESPTELMCVCVCLILCDLENSKVRWPGPTWAVASQKKKPISMSSVAGSKGSMRCQILSCLSNPLFGVTEPLVLQRCRESAIYRYKDEKY
jgi:hypothetical protein